MAGKGEGARDEYCNPFRKTTLCYRAKSPENLFRRVLPWKTIIHGPTMGTMLDSGTSFSSPHMYPFAFMQS